MTTSFCITGVLLGSWEILIILVMLATLAAAVIGTLFLVLFLTRRKPASPPVAPPSMPAPTATHCPRCGAALPSGSPQGLCPRCLMGVGIATPTGTAGGAGPYGTLRVQSSAAPRPIGDIAKLFPQLDILECLGRGGMGVVYKARQPGLDRCVALKILAGEKEADPRFAERFQREARALAKLNHPNIVTVHDFGETGGLYYLLMEYVDGVNLRQLLRGGKITPEQALTIVPSICDALQFAHRQGIVHRDIKPENILLDRDGRVKIADFGIAKMLGAGQPDSLTGELGVVGTPNYMAPEQVERPGRVDHRADIYSLGVVFYEMLTGELPLGRFAPPSQKVAVDVRLDEVVLRSLEKEPERRYQQAGEVKTELETITRVAPAGATPLAAPSFGPASTAPASIPTTAAPASPAAPARFSRTALIGAIWAAFAFFILPSVFIVHSVPEGAAHGPAWWQTLMAFTLLPLAATSPFGTTILGWVAIAQIRRSAGRLYGLGLAVFDGLVFPLLALDAVIALLAAGVTRILHQLLLGHGTGLLAQLTVWLLVLLAIVAIVFADVWIIRAVWKLVNRPLTENPSAPAINTPAAPAPTPDKPAHSTPTNP